MLSDSKRWLYKKIILLDASFEIPSNKVESPTLYLTCVERKEIPTAMTIA